MKATLIALFALVAAPALAMEEIKAGRATAIASAAAAPALGEIFRRDATGSVVARAAAALADSNSQLAPRAEFFCKLPPQAVSGAPLGANDIDGVCVTTSNCFSNPGARAFTGVCPGNTACCIKNDCAGPNSNSACLLPNLQGDTLPNGERGRFVNGECPEDLRCFQLF